MKNIFISFLTGIFLFYSGCSSSSVSSNELLETSVEKWKNATINIEGATDSKTSEERFKIEQEYYNSKAYKEREEERDRISQEYSKKIDNSKSREERIKLIEELFQKLPPIEFAPEIGSRDIRYTGTALFVKYKNHKYLITARHVLHNTLEASRYVKERLDWYKEGNLTIREDERKRIISDSEKRIFSIIYRVPNLSEYLSKTSPFSSYYPPSPVLMNLQAGIYESSAYTFSEPQIDLAVISLERDGSFLSDLEKNGYKPITIDSIWSKSLKEGDDLFCIGYPVTTSPMAKMKGNLAWNASFASLPTISFGKVAMNDLNLLFFLGDMSIYPGNSGSPVVNQDTLVGIISAQPFWKNQNIPFAYIIKIDFLKDLLEEQIKKDNFR